MNMNHSCVLKLSLSLNSFKRRPKFVLSNFTIEILDLIIHSPIRRRWADNTSIHFMTWSHSKSHSPFHKVKAEINIGASTGHLALAPVCTVVPLCCEKCLEVFVTRIFLCNDQPFVHNRNVLNLCWATRGRFGAQ